MQPTDPRRHDSEMPTRADSDTVFDHWWAAVGWQTLRVCTLLLWVGISSYGWLRSIQPPAYTVGVLGATLGLTLAVELFGHRDHHWNGSLARGSAKSRLLAGGCLVGIVAGSLTLAGSLEQLEASQPALSRLTLAGAVLLCGSLLVMAGRQSLGLLGVASLAAVVSLASAPRAELVSAAVGTAGIYGPLTVAALTWIAPACLLVGCWRAAGTAQQLAALWQTAVGRWSTKPSTVEVGRLVGAVGCMVLLVGWQTGTMGSRVVIGLAAVPVGIVGLVSLCVVTRASSPDSQPSAAADRRCAKWGVPTVLVGGPLGVIAVLAVGYRLPVGTTLVAGCLCCLGLYLVRPFVSPGRDAKAPYSGLTTILDGSVLGVQLLGDILLSLVVVGGAVGLIEASGVGTRLIAGVVWLSGGQPLAVVLIVAGCCVALGALLPLVGGYTVGALVGVPLLRLLGPVPVLTAHAVVISSLTVGWLLVAQRGRITVIISNRAEM